MIFAGGYTDNFDGDNKFKALAAYSFTLPLLGGLFR